MTTRHIAHRLTPYNASMPALRLIVWHLLHNLPDGNRALPDAPSSPPVPVGNTP